MPVYDAPAVALTPAATVMVNGNRGDAVARSEPRRRRDGRAEAGRPRILRWPQLGFAITGAEFSRVIVVGAEAGVVPLDWVFETRQEADHSAAQGRERSVFYVACSRARDERVVTWAGAPSPFTPALTA